MVSQNRRRAASVTGMSSNINSYSYFLSLCKQLLLQRNCGCRPISRKQQILQRNYASCSISRKQQILQRNYASCSISRKLQMLQRNCGCRSIPYFWQMCFVIPLQPEVAYTASAVSLIIYAVPAWGCYCSFWCFLSEIHFFRYHFCRMDRPVTLIAFCRFCFTIQSFTNQRIDQPTIHWLLKG